MISFPFTPDSPCPHKCPDCIFPLDIVKRGHHSPSDATLNCMITHPFCYSEIKMLVGAFKIEKIQTIEEIIESDIFE
jgi:hypothetical protein